MAISRYSNAPVLAFGQQLGTSYAISNIRQAIADGNLKYKTIILRGRERLDTIAGEQYNDAKYWWIIAAASNIGWGLQVPPGTVLKIPELNSALMFVI
jgi:hypothetical protein